MKNSAHLPIPQHAVKTEVIFCARGVAAPPFGPFLSDPRAYFDSTNGHFVVTELEIGIDPATGNFGATSNVLIAVSVTDSPLGSWSVFSLDISQDGDARFGGCPTGCFGDQPLIGADANGFYVSTNAFALPPGRFKGAQLYAISLAALESGGGGAISAVHFGNLNVTAGEPARSIQPSINPAGASFESSEGGAEYFVSALDPAHTVDNRVSVWALTNTSSLSSTPDVHLSNIIVDTEGYGFPPAVDQQSGPTPLRDFLASLGFKNHEELVAANDDRMQQVVFADGKLWTAVPTRVQPGGQGPVRAGAAWFIFSPSLGTGHLSASVVNQGYVSIQSPKQNSVLFPAVGVTSAGKAAIVTGGGTGVGRATAFELARQGCSVLVNYSRSRDEAEKTAGEIQAFGVKGITLTELGYDIRKPGADTRAGARGSHCGAHRPSLKAPSRT